MYPCPLCGTDVLASYVYDEKPLIVTRCPADGTQQVRALTYRTAARKVHRDVRTVKRWRRSGMPMMFDPDGYRIVAEPVLQAWFRARLSAWSVHQHKLRTERQRVANMTP